MVGVKGKFKGCNTCRKRRVACDNTRPFCKKCTGHGRQCEGYQTETVFIVGTLKDKGRCASHPPRNLQAASSSSSGVRKKAIEAAASASSSSPEPAKIRKRAASEGEQKDAQLEFTEVNPVKTSSADTIDVASVAGLHRLRFAAIHTKLDTVRRRHERLGDWEVKLSLPVSARVDVVPPFTEDDFQLGAQCFVSLPRGNLRAIQGQSWAEPGPEDSGICLFLYEQSPSASHSNKAPWKDPAILGNPIHRLGPGAFKQFPAHHFFTRVYRPNAIFAALLNHNPTPMADPEWKTVPWERSPKTALDTLLDIMTQLPALLSRTDRVLSLHPGVFRNLKAKDILSVCANVESQFEGWYAEMEVAASRNIECPLLYWPWTAGSGLNQKTGRWEQGQAPFEVTYEFPNSEGGLAHIYYWTGMIVLYGMMARLVDLSRTETVTAGSSSNSNRVVNRPPPGPLPQGPVTPTTVYLQPQAPGHVYGSSSIPPATESYGSLPEEDPNTSPHQQQHQHQQTPSYHLPFYQSQQQQQQPNSPYSVSSVSAHSSPSGRASGDEMVTLATPLLNPNKYGQREIRKLAANVCRSLDWAIGRPEVGGVGPLGQPDLVAAPLYIVERFYDGISAVGDGALERQWCVGFRERWEQRGRQIEARILGMEHGDVGGRGGGGEPVSGAGTGGSSSSSRIEARSWMELSKFGA